MDKENYPLASLNTPSAGGESFIAGGAPDCNGAVVVDQAAWYLQSALVRARMPMKVGTKTVRAAKVAIKTSYRYIHVSSLRSRMLRRLTQCGVVVVSSVWTGVRFSAAVKVTLA